ncbi:hypothetical protein M405DRAFT_859541 [Rhizopogon salebrosus TDB-379]|nr:hypothetical protein M405DRAFT_859541 [Rhizopogon salebrosus TDB-379]
MTGQSLQLPSQISRSSPVTEDCKRVQDVWLCFGGGGFDRRFRVYEISDYGETIRTHKRTEADVAIDDYILAGPGAPAFNPRS